MNQRVSLPTANAKVERHRLYGTACISFGCLLAFIVYRGWALPVEQLGLTLLCTCLAAWPALRWLKLQPYPFPAFEVFMLTCIPFYALQLVSEHEGIAMYDEGVVLKAMLAVILFQVSAMVAFYRTVAFEKNTPFWNEPIFTRDITRWLPLGLWLNVAYLYVGYFTDWLPGDINSILRAIFFGIATACTFLLGRQWGADELNQHTKTNLFLALLTASILQISSLYLISTIASVMVFFLAYISAGKRIPVLPLALIFIVLTVLHNGKGEMRAKYWAEGVPRIQVTDLPELFSEWLEHGLEPFRDSEQKSKQRELLERASLIHIICLVVESTDQGLPFMAGETYGYVAPTLVPRFLWPNKPSGQRTTSRLAIHFGLQTEESAKGTSIGFGVLAEAYANFGYWGMILLGLLIGCFNKVICIWTRNSPLLSNGGLFMILMMAWSIQAEMPMSTWVSSLYQASICVLGIPHVLRRLFN